MPHPTVPRQSPPDRRRALWCFTAPENTLARMRRPLLCSPYPTVPNLAKPRQTAHRHTSPDQTSPRDASQHRKTHSLECADRYCVALTKPRLTIPNLAGPYRTLPYPAMPSGASQHRKTHSLECADRYCVALTLPDPTAPDRTPPSPAAPCSVLMNRFAIVVIKRAVCVQTSNDTFYNYLRRNFVEHRPHH